MDNENKEHLNDAVIENSTAHTNNSPEQPTGQFVNVQAEQLVETTMAGIDAEKAAEQPEMLEDRVKTLSPAAVVAKRFFRSKLSIFGLVTLIVLFIFSFFGPLFDGATDMIWGEKQVDRTEGKLVEINRPYEYTDIDGNDQIVYEYSATNNAFNFDAMPGGNHILGTDKNGYDVFSRLMYGGRVSLTLGFVVVILQTVLGIILGGLAGGIDVPDPPHGGAAGLLLGVDAVVDGGHLV